MPRRAPFTGRAWIETLIAASRFIVFHRRAPFTGRAWIETGLVLQGID